MMLGVSLGDRIRSAREAAGKTREELANQVGVSVKTIGNWETDRVTPKSKLGAVERALGIPLRGNAARVGVDLNDASDAQILANIAGRLAERDERIREQDAELQALRAQLNDTPHADPAREMPQQWARRARERERG